MRLVDVAKRFDRTPCLDAYTGAYLFRAQMSLYDDSKRDSEASERRVISTAADVTIPPRRVVSMLGSRYIVGKANPDVWYGGTIRLGHVAHEAKALATIFTLEELCLNAAGVDAWTGEAWVKNSAFTEQSSGLAPQFHFFFSTTEDLRENQVLALNGEYHLVRSTNDGASGVQVVTTELIHSPAVEVAEFTTGFDPVTATFSGTPQSAKVLRLRWQSLFQYGSKGAPTFGPDDLQVINALAVHQPVPGSKVVMSDGTYAVASVELMGNVCVSRVTRHA